MVYRIAVLYEAVQISDVTGIDLFGNASRACMDMLAKDTASGLSLPPPIAAQAIDMEFLYVSSTLEPAYATPNCKIVPTHTYENCPRDVDVVLVGGPMFSHRPEKSMQLFKDIFAGKGKKGVVFMTTCVGAMWVADAGVLKGKKATTNRMMLQMAGKMHPNVEWVDKRWVVDEMDGGHGEIWTSGGAQCGEWLCSESARILMMMNADTIVMIGVDMIASFIEQRFPHPLSVWARLGLDVNPHVLGQDYKEPIEKIFAKLEIPN